ncbi:MAG: FAD-binding oxidoreductase [Anaerolineales bacterium]
MHPTNLWLTSAPPLPHPTPLPAQTDIAIVGSGYTGLHAALVLAKAGINVTVLEAETIGFGASSRNGGMMTAGLKASLKSIVRMYGLERAREFWQWSLDSIDHVDRTVHEEQIDCDFSRPGHVETAYKPSHFEHFKEDVAWMKKEFNYTGGYLVSRADIRTEIGSDAYFGGLVDDFSAGLQPAKYVFGLAKAVARRGGCLVEKAGVTAIKREGNTFRLRTAKGDITAREVLLATNGYTTGLVPGARMGVFPVGSYIIATDPLPKDLQAELSPKNRMFFDSKHFLNYFRLTPDGRMLFGGRNNLSTDLDLHESARLLGARMVEVFPQLKGVPIAHAWTGKLGITFDLMPHAGRINGIHYAYGYNGHGVSIASYLGKEMGELLAGQRKSVPFMHIKHPRSFITYFDKLYLPFVAAYYRFLDWVA